MTVGGAAGDSQADDAGGGFDSITVGGAPTFGGATSSGGAPISGGAPTSGRAQDSGGGADGGSAGSSPIVGAGNGATAGEPDGSSGTGGSRTNGGAGAGGATSPHELAVGKSAMASTFQPDHNTASGNDGDPTTRWAAANGGLPQWWRVDLNATHALSQVSIRFERADRMYSYSIETSDDDAVYTAQRTASGTAAIQTIDLPAGVAARYLRITLTNGPGGVAGQWSSFYELSVLGF